jgi:Ras-related protein Rab-8A
MSFKGLSSSGSEKRGRPKDPSEATIKLVMVGDSGVGKSCLLEKLLDISSTNAFISTIGVDVRTHVINLNGNSLKLQVRPFHYLF